MTRARPSRRPFILIGVCAAALAAAASARGQEHVDSVTLFQLEARSRPFVIVAGDGEGQTVPVVMERGAEAGTWVLTVEERNRVHFRRSDSGEALVERLDLLRADYAVRYDPPVPLLPAKLTASGPHTSTSTATISRLSTGERLYEADVEHTIERVTRADFDLPHGDVRGYLIEVRHAIDLALADVAVRMDLGFTDDAGLVYRHMKTQVEKLGIFGDTTQRTLVLGQEIEGAAPR